MSMPAVSKHLKVLERAGLIARGREAQWRPCRIEAQALKPVDDGSRTTAASGRSASIASTITCANCRRRKRTSEGKGGSQSQEGEEPWPQEIVSRQPTTARSSSSACSMPRSPSCGSAGPSSSIWTQWSAPRGFTIPYSRGRSAPRRQMALLHARARRQRALARRRLSRDRSEPAAGDDPCLGRGRHARSRDPRDGAVRGSRRQDQGHARSRPASTPPARATATRAAGANASTSSPSISPHTARRFEFKKQGKTWTPSPSTR